MSILMESSSKLVTTILIFCFYKANFRVEALINRLFLSQIFSGIFKKSSIFAAEPFFRIQFNKTSWWVAIDIILVSAVM